MEEEVDLLEEEELLTELLLAREQGHRRERRWCVRPLNRTQESNGEYLHDSVFNYSKTTTLKVTLEVIPGGNGSLGCPRV